MLVFRNPISQGESSLTYSQCSPIASRPGTPASSPQITRHLPTAPPPGIFATLPSVTGHSQLVPTQPTPHQSTLGCCLATNLLNFCPTKQPTPSCNSPRGILTFIPPTTERRSPAASPPDVAVNRTTTNQDMAAFLLNQIGIPTIKIKVIKSATNYCS